jgi:starch synthase (maltosyl-transferring)
MGLPEQRLTVIPNGVDLARIDEAAPIEKATLGLPETARIALFIGRLTHQKGVDVLLAAAREVLPAHPDWRLVLVGDGPERQAVLSTIQADPRLATHAHWLGRRDDVPRLLRTADLLVLPSRWEGMPNVVLEAMAARCPVVATDVEGCDELVLPLRSGWLVEPGNPDRLARALSAAMADPGERAHHAAIARRIVAAQYTTARMIAAYDRLWSRLLGYADDTPEPPAPAEATE